MGYYYIATTFTPVQKIIFITIGILGGLLWVWYERYCKAHGIKSWTADWSKSINEDKEHENKLFLD